MKIPYLKNIKKFKPSVVAIGVFDGAHKGHLEILNQTKKIAAVHNLKSSVLTFYPHPLSVLKPALAPVLITDLEERLHILKKTGIKQTAVVKFDKKFAQKKAEEFVKNILLKKLNAKWVVVGSDYRFGRETHGDKKILSDLGEKLNFKVTFVEPLKFKGHKISSSLIRQLIAQDKLEDSAKCLGRYYSVKGKVVKGRGRGKALGFPTANLDIPRDFLIKGGVYVGQVIIAKNQKLPAMIDVGMKPTFKGKTRLIEVNILDFSGKLYGKNIEVFFIKKLREEKKFKTPAHLITQIQKDREKTLRVLEKVA
ncbi:MAG: bifunctional riboflavin kinase/FAD synthetase [Candidatus Omnitrophota bacterium]